MIRIMFLILLFFTATSQIFAAPFTYEFDKENTNIAFDSDTDGTFEIKGEFPEYAGILKFDEDDFESSSIEVTINAPSVTSSNLFVLSTIKSKGLFDVENHPEVKFKSTEIIKLDASFAEVIGDLTIKGITKQVIMQAELKERSEGMSRLVFSGLMAISRKDFNMDAWSDIVSDIVTVDIRAEFTRQ